MATGDGTIHEGRDRHVRLAREDEFGSPPSSADWTCLPLDGNGWSVRSARDWFLPEPAMDGASAEPAAPGLLSPRGRLSVAPHPEAVQFLLDAALNRPAPDGLHTYCADHVTPVESRRYLGMAAAGLTLSAVADRVRIGLRLCGHDEVAGTGVTSSDFDYSGLTAVPFSLRGAHLELDGAALEAVSGFTLRVNNDLQPGPNVGNRTAYLLAGRRTVTLRLHGLHGGSRVDEALREGGSVGFSADFSHPAGHSLWLRLPRLLPRRSEGDGPPGRPARRTARLVAARDPSAGHDIDYGVSLSS